MNAILFDLDDTLYSRRRWLLSGFAALARYLEVATRLDRRETFRYLVRMMRTGRSQVAFQHLCERYGLSHELIPGFVKLVRSHKPTLTLHVRPRQLLTRLRPAWRLGVLTNGPPSVQARKADALGVSRLVDSVVYAAEYGAGKPEPRPFLELAARVGVPPSRCVFVGDDLWCDIHGARLVGMRTVRMRRFNESPTPYGVPEADVVIDDLDDVADSAAALISKGRDDADDDLRTGG